MTGLLKNPPPLVFSPHEDALEVTRKGAADAQGAASDSEDL